MNRVQLLISILGITLSLGAMQKSVSITLTEELHDTSHEIGDSSHASPRASSQTPSMHLVNPEKGFISDAQKIPPIEIVDQATNPHLVDSIRANRPTYIFGATPRYLLFVRFIEVLVHHFTLLNQHYERSRALKCVSKEIKTLFKELKMHNPALHPAETIKSLSLQDKMKLFFALGFQQEQLKDNFHDLCVSINARAKNEPLHLIHVLLPCYLDGCTEVYAAQTSVQRTGQDHEIRPLTQNKLSLFMHESALFYKGLYEQNTGNSLTVHLVIPQHSYFEEMAHMVKKGPLSSAQKEESICTFLCKEVLAHTTKAQSPLVIVNQNPQEIGSLIQRLLASGIERPMLDGLYLTIRVGIKPTTVFNPYIVNVTSTDDDKYTDSPIIKKELLPILLKGMNHATH